MSMPNSGYLRNYVPVSPKLPYGRAARRIDGACVRSYSLTRADQNPENSRLADNYLTRLTRSRFVVSGELLVCDYLPNPSCPESLERGGVLGHLGWRAEPAKVVSTCTTLMIRPCSCGII